MLQSSLSTIKQHFSPSSTIHKNIFLTKDYDYPPPFYQNLYLSYLQLQQSFTTKSHQQIAKRINIFTNKNDKNYQKTILAFVYAIILHYPTANTSTQNKLKEKSKLLDSDYDLKIFSTKFIQQLDQFFPYFRNQTWTLFNHISLQLITNCFSEIKPLHRFGFIGIFKYMQKSSACQDDYFMALMKTLNIYDQKKLSMKYNIDLICELNEVIISWRKSTEGGYSNTQEIQKSFSNMKINSQMSLMRLYLFSKLVHWQYMKNKMSAYLKGQWPFNLQRTFTQGLKILKSLYQSNPQQCLVFSCQYARYIQPQAQDYQLKEIYMKIAQSSQRPISQQLIGHHFSLVPISLQFLIPFQLQQKVNEMARNLYQVNQQNGPYTRVQRQNVHMIIAWIWKDFLKEFSEQNSKNYLIENVYQDLVRWCLVSHSKNLELRSFLIEWVIYNSGHNETLSKSIKQAFFSDWIYYLKIARYMDLNVMFGVLSTSIHILNYFSFCAPSIGEQLFSYILGKSIYLKSQYQTGVTSEGMFRVYINQIIRRANKQGILRVREILYQSQLSNYIKAQIEARIKEGETSGTDIYGKDLRQKHKEMTNQRNTIKESIYNGGSISNQQKTTKIIQEEKPILQKTQYYGDKSLEIDPEKRRSNNWIQQEHSDEDDLIYTSHELIPSSPTYSEDNEPYHKQQLGTSNNQHGFTLEENFDTQQYQEQLNVYGTTNQQILNQNYLDLRLQERHNLQNKQITEPVNLTIQTAAKLSQPQDHQIIHQTNQINQVYQIKLQKQYLQEMGPFINSLIQSPTIHQFTEYMKQLIRVLKQYKKSSQQEEMIEKFIQQSTKVLYLIFNKQFQSFDFNIDESKQTKESQFLSYFLLRSIHQYCKQSLVNYNVFVYKKLVKCLCEAFPSAQFTFYHAFLDIFKKGTVHFKEMKPWLIQTEKQKVIIPILQKLLGNNFKMHIYENAQTEIFLKILNSKQSLKRKDQSNRYSKYERNLKKMNKNVESALNYSFLEIYIL